MLKKSRISRSIITVLYVIAMCIMLYYSAVANSVYHINSWKIIVYILVICFCVCFYQILKRRLNNKIKFKSLIHIYRYMYLAIVLVVSRIIMVFCLKDTTSIYLTGTDESLPGKILDLLIHITREQKYAAIVLNTVIAYAASVIIKQIMLNIFNNDAVATTTSILYILSPVSLILCLEYNASIFNTLYILTGILVIMKIYDQITQYGLKNNVYIYLSIVLGAVLFLDILFGGSYISWIILVICLNLVSDYIDSIYIDVSKIQILQKIFKLKKNEKLAVKKSILVLGIICAFCVPAIIVSNILEINNGIILNLPNIPKAISNGVGLLKLGYIVGSGIIIIFEILACFMRRQTISKATLIQVGIIVFGIFPLAYLNTSYNLCIYDSILCIACILSVSNIYYNRNEKVKLLKEKN